MHGGGQVRLTGGVRAGYAAGSLVTGAFGTVPGPLLLPFLTGSPAAGPALRADLGADRGEIQWILAVYSLTFGLALVPAGRLGDAYGRGRLLVAGLALFSGASLIGVFATAPWVLVVARLLQGVGAGVANPQVIGLLSDYFTGPARARALGAYAAVASVAAVIAPVGRWGRPSVTAALVLLMAVCLAAFTGVFVGAATPGALGGYRTGLETSLWIAAGLTAVGATASAADRPVTR